MYHWDAKEQKVVNRLDCSKLVPCSESLQSISIEEHLSPSHCQVRIKHFGSIDTHHCHIHGLSYIIKPSNRQMQCHGNV